MQRAQSELIDWQGRGISIMEFSHRSKDFIAVAEQTERDLRALMSIPDNYKVLFCAGGATFHFANIPMNLLSTRAVYVNTGAWGAKAIKEAKKYGDISVIDGLSEVDGKQQITEPKQWQLPEQFDYLHYTPNETISGIEFAEVPDVAKGKLVADMSSNILSQTINIEDFAVIYAGAQKNIGPSGLSIVIIRDDLLQREKPSFLPSLLNYQELADKDSMSNTPPTFAWYLAGLVFDWIIKQGGVEEMARRAQSRSQLLYDFIDGNNFYTNKVADNSRSRMNVSFLLNDESANSLFLQESSDRGLLYLKGHRSVGGMRASIYNAMPQQGVEALTEFMADFANRRG
jgi:phosphoserine aminotransferase